MNDTEVLVRDDGIGHIIEAWQLSYHSIEKCLYVSYDLQQNPVNQSISLGTGPYPFTLWLDSVSLEFLP